MGKSSPQLPSLLRIFRPELEFRQPHLLPERRTFKCTRLPGNPALLVLGETAGRGGVRAMRHLFFPSTRLKAREARGTPHSAVWG